MIQLTIKILFSVIIVGFNVACLIGVGWAIKDKDWGSMIIMLFVLCFALRWRVYGNRG